MVDDGSVESIHPRFHSVFPSFQLSISIASQIWRLIILQFATLLFLANDNKNNDDDDDYNTVF